MKKEWIKMEGGRRTVLADTGEYIYCPGKNDDEAEVNAFRISAVHDMYEALKDITGYGMIRGVAHQPSIDHCRCQRCCFDRAKQALEKADGK